MKEFLFLVLLAAILNFILLFYIRIFFRLRDFLKDIKGNFRKLSLNHLLIKNLLFDISIFVLFFLLLFFYFQITIIFLAYYVIYFFALKFLLYKNVERGNIIFILSTIIFITTFLIFMSRIPTVFIKGKTIPEMWLFHITNSVLYDFLKFGSKFGIKYGEFGFISNLIFFIKRNLVGFLFLLPVTITAIFFKHLKRIINLPSTTEDNFYFIKIPKEVFFISIILLILGKVLSINSLILTMYGLYFLEGYSIIIYFLKGGKAILNFLLFFIILIFPLITVILVIVGFLDGMLDLRRVRQLLETKFLDLDALKNGD